MVSILPVRVAAVWKRVVLMTMALVAALALALPGAGGGVAVARASATFTAFQMPSKQIACMYSRGGGEPTQLRCDVANVVNVPKRPASCGLDYGHAFGLSATKRATRLCAGDTVLDPGAPVLAYGKTKHYGPFTCTARTSGLRCSTRAGHGFVLARQKQTLF